MLRLRDKEHGKRVSSLHVVTSKGLGVCDIGSECANERRLRINKYVICLHDE